MVLGELLIVLVATGVVAGLSLATWLVFVRSAVPARITVGGRSVPVAPTYAVFPSAVRLHAVFQHHLAASRCVYVFGGDHLGLESEAPVRLGRPLAADHLPGVTLSAGLPEDSGSFYAAYADQLGPEKASAAPGEFTVLVFGPRSGMLAPLCLVQVEQVEASVKDGYGGFARYTLHTVRLWDADGTAECYAFAEPAARRSAFVGAMHTWYRYSPAGGASEEGPAVALFPDPWLWAGSRAEPGETGAFSRFGYLLCLNP